MIQLQTILKVSDNSGAKTAKCIKVLGGFKKKYAKLGDIIIVTIQQLRNKTRKTSQVKKSEIYKALIVRTKKTKQKKDGLFISFADNSIILINKQGTFIGSRILGPTHNTLNMKQFQKLNTISAGLI